MVIFKKMVIALCAVVGVGMAASGADKYVAAEGVETLDVGGVAHEVTHNDIQAAIDDETTVAGDTVWVADGFVCDSGDGRSLNGLSRILVKKGVVLRSVSGSYEGGAMIVGGRDNSASYMRCVALEEGASLVGLILTNGFASVNDYAKGGGGVHFAGVNGVVSNCFVTRCKSQYGGGAFVPAHIAKGAKVYDSVIENCETPGYGGVVIVSANCGTENFELIDCIVRNNKAKNAGAMYRGTARNCWFEGNRGDSGGALGYDARGYNCVITNNTSNLGGGAGDHEATGPIVYDSLIIGNHSTGNGGGTAKGIFYNCVIEKNTAKGSGGGANAGTFYNCIIRENSANTTGGGTAGSTLHNTVVINNHAKGNGGGVDGGTLENCTVYGNESDTAVKGINSGSSTKINNSISWNNDDGEGVNWSYSCAANASGTGCTTEDPLLVLDEESGIPIFASGVSPCIDTGAAKNAKTPDTDILGKPRLSGNGYDMGAVEFDASGDDKVMVEGDIANLGVSVPTYGITNNVAIGSNINFSFPNPDGIVNPDTPGVLYSCVGYKVISNNEDKTLLAEGNATSFTYTHQGASTVRWLFAPTHYEITAGYAHGGKIDNTGTIAKDAEITLTATPDSGMEFVRWVGDTDGLTEDTLLSPELAITVTKPMKFHALFKPQGAPDKSLYVSESGEPNADYGIGCSDLQAAIDAAKNDETIWIADGFVCDDIDGYTIDKHGARCRIVIDKPITVRSVNGTINNDVLIVGAPHSATVEQGDSSVKCVFLGSGAELIGVTITNGYARATDDARGAGGGIYIDTANVTVSDCLIVNCKGNDGGGMGVWSSARDCKVVDSVFAKCESRYGNAVLVNGYVGDNFVMLRCTFKNMQTSNALLYRGTAKECVMTQCYAPLTTAGAASYNCIFTNNNYNCVREGNHYNGLFIGNKTDNNAVYDATLYNCTVYGNKKGVGGSAKLYNTIVWGNDTNISGTGVTSVNSCAPTLTPGENGNINEEPIIRLNKHGIPLLRSASPCIDSGDNQYVNSIETDLLGNKRIRRGKTEERVDMGAVEFAHTAMTIILK